MKHEVIKRVIYGIASGGAVTFLALTVLLIAQIHPPMMTIWLYSLASFALGIYFGLGSFIFDIEAWSPLKRTAVHYILSIVVYFIIAITVGWIPFTVQSILLGVLLFSLIYAVYWNSYRIYYKKVEAEMNEHLLKK